MVETQSASEWLERSASPAADDPLAGLLPGPLRRERERWYTPDRTVRNVHWVRFALVLVALSNRPCTVGLPAGTRSESTRPTRRPDGAR